MKILIFALLAVTQCFGAYGWYILHTPAASQVSSGPHTDFPVLIDITDNALRVTGSGGNVTDAQGDDIQPASDATCTTFLKFERIAYDGTTGRVRMHVKVPSLSSSSNVYLCFGDGSVTTDQSDPTNVWNSGYAAVYHLGDGSTLSTSDSTANALTLTNTGPVNATTGKIYGAAGTNWSTTVYLSRASSAANQFSGNWTVSAWVNPSSCSSYGQIVYKGQNVSRNYELDMGNSGCKIRAVQTSGGVDKATTSTAAVSTGAWSHLSARYDGTNVQSLINGTVDGSIASGAPDTSTASMRIGIFENSGIYTNPFAGTIDEVRISNTNRSDGWLTTEYNSGTPSTFWDTGSVTAVGVLRPSRRFVQ